MVLGTLRRDAGCSLCDQVRRSHQQVTEDFSVILPMLEVKHVLNHLETRVVLLLTSLLLHCLAGVWEHHRAGPS